MVDPRPLAAEKEEAQAFSLWADAPAWRNLTIAATLLTVAAAGLALPNLMSSPPSAPTFTPPHLSDQTPPSTTIGPPTSPTPGLVQKPAPDAPPSAHGIAPGAAQSQALAPAPQIAPAPAEPQPQTRPQSQPLPRSVAHAPIAAQDQASVAAQTQVAPLPQQTVCLLVAPPAPTHFGRGTVMSFEDRATSLERTKHNEAALGGKLDPEYADNQRVNVRDSSGAYHVFIVPKTLVVRLGDAVAVQSLYKNVNRTCEYIPPLITSDLGPAPDKDAPSPPSGEH